MNTVGVIGYGRFGKVLVNILQKGFLVNVYDININNNISGVNFTDLKNILKEESIFISVPINEFETVINQISRLIKYHSTVIDVCSVKSYPVKIMEKRLPKDIGIIATHPMFGPDSYTTNKKLKMMMNNTRDKHEKYNFWKNYFNDQGINIIEMSEDQHDKLAAKTQGITHLLGRILKDFGIQGSPIDTQGFKDLLNIVDQTCNDSWELFNDLQLYNPYTLKMINNLKKSFYNIEKKIIKD